ncbi:hypothetical protein SZ64_10325 [Erythrobacter sp. SG61-1L]|nr:hypothetical protein SZ64_10325 [Erythrobacter sp. SG61-1L]
MKSQTLAGPAPLVSPDRTAARLPGQLWMDAACAPATFGISIGADAGTMMFDGSARLAAQSLRP